MEYAICMDFGSTYTKVVCVDLKKKQVVMTDKFPSTVKTDACIAMEQCFDAAKQVIGEEAFSSARKLSTSSAAGGLRMAVVGLTKTLSIEAGRNASFSAGAKIVQTATGLLSTTDVEALETSDAEILLLCGGYEKGNTKAILHNAKLLSESRLTIPIIYAGNSDVAPDVRRMMMSNGKECFLAENIIPAIGTLNIESTAEIIRDLFMKRITNMKGVGVVQSHLDGPIIPTPAAVLAAGELLSMGTEGEAGLGPLMMADVGGATTDIYSYISNEGYEGAKCIGAYEPFAKRTVEGDMGMRESSVCLVEEVGRETFAKVCDLDTQTLEDAINKRITATDYVADEDIELKIDRQIAKHAVRISARRHAGHTTREFSSKGKLVQYGKNLTQIQTIIGIGGILVYSEEPEKILEGAKTLPAEVGRVLLPSELEILIDRNYVFYAAGLLREYDEEAALAIMKQSLGL